MGFTGYLQTDAYSCDESAVNKSAGKILVLGQVGDADERLVVQDRARRLTVDDGRVGRIAQVDDMVAPPAPGWSAVP